MESERIGVIVGRGRERQHLEMVIAFSEREKAPKLGSFLVVEEQEFMKRKFLSRVEDMNYGDFQATKDERIRAIVEKYMREVAGYGRELSEEEKKALFFRHYIVRVLGEISADDKAIVTEYRLLPELSAICRTPTEAEYETITSAGLQDAGRALKVGKLVIGKEEKENDILFEPWKFERRRTAIFARTGYGKSNLCKVVVSLASLAGNIGILVLDIEGEYAFKTRDRSGKEILGLADLDRVKPNLVVYTERKDAADYYNDVLISPILNLEVTQPFYVARLFEEQELAVVDEFRYMPEDKRQEWRRFIQAWREAANNWREREDALTNFVENLTTRADQQGALRRILRPVLELDNPEASSLVQDVMYHLSLGRVVVLDLSLMPLERALSIADLVLDGILKYNIRGITVGKTINTIAVFEEAQNVLNRKAVDEGRSVFARWAKEGRKFQLGLIYVTQQPGAIAEEIVSQTDNFFVMHLLNKGDIDALRKANPHYADVVADFLSMETFVGNTYIYSAPLQPYVFPAKVLEFNKKFFDAFPKASEERKGALDELREMAEALRPEGAKKYEQRTSFVGACSRRIYQYLKNNGISAPFMIDEKGWIDYQIAENLVGVLEKRGLLRSPAIQQRAAMEGIHAEAEDG